MKLPDFVEVFVKLIKGLQQTLETNTKRAVDEKKAEERAKKEAARKGAKLAGAVPAMPMPSEQEEGGAERGVIDELMTRLQTGSVQLRKAAAVRTPQMRGPQMPQMSELQMKMAQRLAKQQEQNK